MSTFQERPGARPAPTAAALASLDRPHRPCIGGEWREGGGERRIEVENPAREETLAHLRAASQADVDDAVVEARAASEGPWRRMTGRERGALLFRFADLLDGRGVPGAGITLGPALTLGWIAGQQLAKADPIATAAAPAVAEASLGTTPDVDH